MPFDRDKIKTKLAELASQGVLIGTSSWKYEGWQDQLYCRDRYIYRGKYGKERFDDNCLAEYAEVFKTVSVDGAYYKLPTPDSLKGLADEVPDDFQFAFKVTDAITRKTFPNVKKSGLRAGQTNPDFLNADLFATAFLQPCEQIRPKIGVLMFEFSRFGPTDYRHEDEFLAQLDIFLSKLPKGWPYAVEMRNANWLGEKYFNCLVRHKVTHVYNSWEAMPSIGEQMKLAGSRPNPSLIAARFLLKPGRKYEDAVKEFFPYQFIKEKNEDARNAGKALVASGKIKNKGGKTLIYVNNRLEGNALETINAMIED